MYVCSNVHVREALCMCVCLDRPLRLYTTSPGGSLWSWRRPPSTPPPRPCSLRTCVVQTHIHTYTHTIHTNKHMKSVCVFFNAHSRNIDRPIRSWLLLLTVCVENRLYRSGEAGADRLRQARRRRRLREQVRHTHGLQSCRGCVVSCVCRVMCACGVWPVLGYKQHLCVPVYVEQVTHLYRHTNAFSTHRSPAGTAPSAPQA